MQMGEQVLDALAYSAMRDVQFFRGVREIQVPRGRFEEAKRLERRAEEGYETCGNESCANR